MPCLSMLRIDMTNGVRKGSFSKEFNLTLQSNHMVVVVVPWERKESSLERQRDGETQSQHAVTRRPGPWFPFLCLGTGGLVIKQCATL